VSPETVHEVFVLVHDFPSGIEVTVYFVIGLPPVCTGAVHETTEAPLRFEVADTAVGASGTRAGVTDDDGAEAGPGPIAFVAVTVNVYAKPFVSPVTVHEVVALVQVAPPGLAVTP
jgi:hypothetical protein